MPTPQTPEPTVPFNSPRSVQQTVKTKELFIRQQTVDKGGGNPYPALTSQSFTTQPEVSQPQSLDQGKQRFIRERAQKTVVQKIEVRRLESAASMSTERSEITKSPVSCSGQTSSESIHSMANTPLLKQEINQEFDAKLEELKATATYDKLSLSVTRAPWREVLAVYAVKTTSDPVNGQEVVSMTDEKEELLKQVFWDINEVSSFTSTIPGEGDETDTTTLYITVAAKTTDEMADLYGFTARQHQQLAELLSDEHRELWGAPTSAGTSTQG